jgi:hypothetical protein
VNYDFVWVFDSIKALAMLYAWTLFTAGAFALGERIVGSPLRNDRSISRDTINKR